MTSRGRTNSKKKTVLYYGSTSCGNMTSKTYLFHDASYSCRGLPAVLPYIGAYLDVIYTLDISSKTYNESGLVNFAKMTKLADMVTKVLQYQKVEFNFEPKLEVGEIKNG